MTIKKMPENSTEVQAAVLQLRSGRNKNILKFCSFMVLMFMAVSYMFYVTASISDLAKPGIESVIGAFNE